MTGFPPSARSVWRSVRICARYMDRVLPFWWKNQATLVTLTRGPSETANRCWRQCVRQRIGD